MPAKIKSLPRCAILDDYQDAAFSFADWSALEGKVEITRFAEHLPDEDTRAAALADFEIIVAMRERTPFPRSLLARLPNLKLLVTTGMRNRSIDAGAAKELGITFCGTPSVVGPAAELAWGGLIALYRNLPDELANFRKGGPWQLSVGRRLSGLQLGIVGLGRLGGKVSQFGKAFDMDVVGWNRSNLEGRASELDIKPMALPALFETSDVIFVMLSLTPETRGIISADLIARMKTDATLVNAARGPLVDEEALIAALTKQSIYGAVLDTYGQEPLPLDHPFRRLKNVIATPHLGYVTTDSYSSYYSGSVDTIANWIAGTPVRVIEP
jgi:phosphoglycerate dehydrogenase-like enzyme